MKYYKCVNCGYHGNFGFDRQRGVACEVCEYDMLTQLSEEEYTEWAAEFKYHQIRDPFYKSKGKVTGTNLLKALSNATS